MTVIAVCSVKHSPGATTLCLALASAWGNAGELAILVEADPAGGDLAARIGLAIDPGLVSMAAAARHADSVIDIARHARPLPCGGSVVIGPTSPDEAEAAVATIAARVPKAVRSVGAGVVDCGRWTRNSPTSQVMRSADMTLVVARPDLAGIAHLQERVEQLSASAGGRLGVVLVGDRPYPAANVAAAIGIPTVFTIAIDRDGVDALYGAASARAGRRSRLVRSARTVLDAIDAARVEVFA
jgi:MinD-like ATPase involved in chromosome partitioning or flagellar assembly